jgi:hypothetical protein
LPNTSFDSNLSESQHTATFQIISFEMASLAPTGLPPDLDISDTFGKFSQAYSEFLASINSLF